MLRFSKRIFVFIILALSALSVRADAQSTVHYPSPMWLATGSSAAASCSGNYTWTSWNTNLSNFDSAAFGSQAAMSSNGSVIAVPLYDFTYGGYYYLYVNPSNNNEYPEDKPYYSPGYLFVSTNGGTSWTTNVGLNYWMTAASSSDGSHLAAVPEATGPTSNMYTSTNSGSSWTQQTGAGTYWYSIASDSTGNYLAA